MISLLLATPRALAEDVHALTIAFQVDPDEQPTHVCVVTSKRSGSYRGRDGGEKNELQYSLDLAQLKLAFKPSQDSPGEDVLAPWSELPAALVSGLETRPYIRDALRTIASVPDDDDCGGSYAGCAPRMAIDALREQFSKDWPDKPPDSMFMSCGKNSARVPEPERTVLLTANFIQQRDLPIIEIRIDGSVASIIAKGAATSDPVVIKVVGGHYLVETSYQTTGNRAVIPLTPRCSMRHIDVTRLVGEVTEPLNVELSRFGSRRVSGVLKQEQSTRTCHASVVGGQFSMLTPKSTRKELNKLKVTLVDPSYPVGVPNGGARDEETTEAMFLGTASWSDFEPPKQIELDIKATTFYWRPDCTFPLERISHAYTDTAPTEVNIVCPQATLNGVEIAGVWDERRKVCSYFASSNAPFRWPESVRFREVVSYKGDDRSGLQWDGEIELPGQVLSDYVRPEERTIVLDFWKWRNLSFVEKTRIKGIELVLPTGETRFIPIEDAGNVTIDDDHEIRVRIPHIACGDSLRYRTVGERFSRLTDMEVDRGRAYLAPAYCIGGRSWSYGRDDHSCSDSHEKMGLDFYAAFGLGVATRRGGEGLPRYEPLKSFHLSGFVGGSFVKWDGLWFAGTGILTTIGSREYVRVPLDGGPDEIAGAAYGRMAYDFQGGLRLPILRPAFPHITVGGGVSVGAGFPLSGGEAAALAAEAFLMPYGFLRIGPIDSVVRVLLFEDLARVREGGQFLSDAGSDFYLVYELQYRHKLF